jgi:hypothetical protein
MGRKLTAVRNAPKVLGHHIAKHWGHYAAGVLLLAVGGFFIYSARHFRTGSLRAELLSELGIAVWISVLIAALIEFHLARKTFAKGLDAIMNQTVPEEVWSEIRQHVISQPMLRYDWAINMSLDKEPDEKGRYKSTTTLTYDIQSLRDLRNQEIHHEIDHPRVVDPARPFRSIKRQNLREVNSQEPTSGEPKKIHLESDGQEESLDLRDIVKDGRKASFWTFFLYEKEWKRVEVSFQEWVNPTDVINWWMNIATRKIRVEVDVPSGLNVELHAHHPEENILGKSTPAEANPKRWETSETAVMLPGQGFELRFKPNAGQSTPQAANGLEETVAPVPAVEAHKAG